MCWLAWIAVVSCSLRTRPTREPTTVSSSATGGWSSKERRRSEDDRFPIYFKTGNHSLKDRQHAEDEGYVVFDRTDFLRILATYRGTNSILLDFCRHLKRWQRETDSFRKWTRDGKRTSRGWDGFYRHIEESSLVGYEGDWGPLTTRVGSYWGYGSNRQRHEQEQQVCGLDRRGHDQFPPVRCEERNIGAWDEPREVILGQRVCRAGRRPVD